MAMSVSAALDAPAPVMAYRRNPEALAALEPRHLTAGRKRVLELLAPGLAMMPRDIAQEAGVSPAVVRGLLDLGALEAVALPEAGPPR
ncbi:MAG: primosomal protein N', partial [Alphaproteobacteria bacterium]|nr:primosomal protein N' [Alphaproteobacteria bacterium]